MALSDLNLSHNRLRTLQNRTNGLFEDCLSIRKVEILPFVQFVFIKVKVVAQGAAKLPEVKVGGTKKSKIGNLATHVQSGSNRGAEFFSDLQL